MDKMPRLDPERVRQALPEALRRHLTDLLLREAISPEQVRVLEKLERAAAPEWWRRFDRVCAAVPPVPVEGTHLVDIEPQLRALAREFGFAEDEVVELARRREERNAATTAVLAA